jgi:hypothetical protein
MRRIKTAIATGVMIATGAAIGLLPMGLARAGEGSDVQELRREVSRMRAEVQAMQVAIMQANELERQRTAKLTKALEEQAAAVPSDPPPLAPAGDGPAAPAAPTPQVLPASSGGDKGKGAARRKHHKRAGRSHSKSGH